MLLYPYSRFINITAKNIPHFVFSIREKDSFTEPGEKSEVTIPSVHHPYITDDMSEIRTKLHYHLKVWDVKVTLLVLLPDSQD